MAAKPEKHVFVCVQQRPQGHPFGSCAEGGAQDILTLFNQEIIKRDLAGKVMVTGTACQGGPCREGASVLVYPEGIKYRKITSSQDVMAIFDDHLLGDTPVQRLQVPADLWG